MKWRRRRRRRRWRRRRRSTYDHPARATGNGGKGGTLHKVKEIQFWRGWG
jgi:hypothetical protein